MTHTKKWTKEYDSSINNYYIFDGEESIADVNNQMLPEEENEANAQLISSAPDLLEACKEAQKLVSMARKYFPKSIKNSDTFNLNNVSANIIQQAINKAEEN